MLKEANHLYNMQRAEIFKKLKGPNSTTSLSSTSSNFNDSHSTLFRNTPVSAIKNPIIPNYTIKRPEAFKSTKSKHRPLRPK